MKPLTRVLMLVLVGGTMSLLVGCSRHDNNERYILVTVLSKLPYWQTAAAGLNKAGAQYGVKTDVRGPDTFDPQAEVKEFRDAMALKPAGILVSVADTALMQPVINEAIEIARKFSSPESVQFINGVLDSVGKQIEAGPR